jgi:hypothetical protein
MIIIIMTQLASRDVYVYEFVELSTMDHSSGYPVVSSIVCSM